MAYTRTVKFSYYTVCIMEDEQDVSPKRFDFEAWIKKYISETIGYGLIDACISLSIYTRDVIANKCILKILNFLFIYLLLLFLLATYRGMSCMLKLIFSNDKNIHEDVSGALNDSDKSSLWEQKGK